MNFEDWKELIGLIFQYAMILVFTIAVVVTISQLIVNSANVNNIIDAYKKIGQILPFS